MKLLYSHSQAVVDTLQSISHKYRVYKNLCDLGCGTGFRGLQFAEYDRRVTLVDLNDIRVSECKKKNIRFLQGDFFKMKLKAESFDMIMSFDVIEHLEQPELLLKEIYRLLIPGGICILSTPNRYRIVNAILLAMGKRKYPYCISADHDDYPEYWHITEFTDKQIRNMAIKNKFDVIEHYKIYYGLSGGMGFRSIPGMPFYHNHIHILKKIK